MRMHTTTCSDVRGFWGKAANQQEEYTKTPNYKKTLADLLTRSGR